MVDFFINSLAGIPAAWAVLLIAMIPIVELRGALPVALTYYKLNLAHAYFLSVAGNILPVIFILLYIGPVSDWLRKNNKLMERFFAWLFKRTRHKVASQYEKYGLAALAIFVAIPLPMTGAWTGALAAWLFGVDNKRGFIAILAGVALAGVIVALATTGVVGFLNFLL
ncbi:MAG: small multi-drug export protein [Patescibacteria group bacterium]